MKTLKEIQKRIKKEDLKKYISSNETKIVNISNQSGAASARFGGKSFHLRVI